MNSSTPLRVGFVGRWTGGTDALAAGFRAAWPDDTAPRILGIESIEDIRTFANDVDAWLLLHGDCLPHLDFLRGSVKPIVGRSVEYEPFGIPIAPTADEAAGEIAGQLLAATCPARLIYLGPDKTFSHRRRAGFLAPCAATGRTGEALDLATTDLPSLVSFLPSGSGLFTFNDETGYIALHLALAAGKRIPEDLAIIGIDNAPVPDSPAPRLLTTLAFSARDQGQAMGQLLRAQLENHPHSRRTDIPPGPLLHRQTTAQLDSDNS